MKSYFQGRGSCTNLLRFLGRFDDQCRVHSFPPGGARFRSRDNLHNSWPRPTTGDRPAVIFANLLQQERIWGRDRPVCRDPSDHLSAGPVRPARGWQWRALTSLRAGGRDASREHHDAAWCWWCRWETPTSRKLFGCPSAPVMQTWNLVPQTVHDTPPKNINPEKYTANENFASTFTRQLQLELGREPN